MSCATVPPNPPGISKDEAQELVEMAADGIFVADFSGRCTYANAAAARILGWEAEQVPGLSLLDLVRPKDVPRLLGERDALLQGQARCSEWQLRRRDGSWIDVEITATMLRENRWHSFMRDISHRKTREAEAVATLQRVDAQRAWLDEVIRRLPVGIVLFRNAERTTFNQAAEALLGGPLSPGAGPEQYAARIFYPDGERVPLEDFPSMRALLRGESKAATELLIRREDGTQSHVITSAAPICDSEGRVLGAAGVFQDVTERMRLQETVRENERLLEAVFELMPTGVRVADRNGKVVRTNRAARELWRGRPDGPTEGEMKAWWLKTGEFLEHQDWPARRAAQGETISNELVRMQCFDGSFRTVMKRATPLRDDSGHITGAVVVDEDVTALFESKEKLEAGERLFRTVFELLPVGLYIADRDGHVILGNPEGERIWQGVRYVGPDQFEQYKGWWIDTGRPISADEWGVARAIRRGETSRSELVRIQAFDGSTKVVMNWAAPLRSETGEITGAVALNQDVTALYRTQEQLRNAVQEREHILAVVAHDLRNPLSGLALRAAVAEGRIQALPKSEELRQSIAAMRQIAQGMSGLVDDLLAIAAGQSGQSMIELTPIEPGAVVRRAAELAKPSYAAAGVDLVVQVAPNLPVMQVDVNRIQRVFANLLDNAAKFTPSGGRVVLEVHAQAGAILFGVANSGPALQQDELQHMFRPFWQAGPDRRGVGLGLSICRSIIEAHGGSIWAEAAPGMQVHVRFLLPTAIPKQEPSGR